MKKAEAVIPPEVLTILTSLQLLPCLDWSLHHSGPNVQLILDFRRAATPTSSVKKPGTLPAESGGPEKRKKKKSPATISRDTQRLAAWREKKTQFNPQPNRGEQTAERTTAELDADLRNDTQMELHSSQESIFVSTANTSADEGSYDCEAMEAIEAMTDPIPLPSPLQSTSTPPPKKPRRSEPLPAPPKEATSRTSEVDHKPKDQVVRNDLLRLKKTVSEEDEERARELEERDKLRAEVQEALRTARLSIAPADEHIAASKAAKTAKATPSSTKKKRSKKK